MPLKTLNTISITRFLKILNFESKNISFKFDKEILFFQGRTASPVDRPSFKDAQPVP